MEISVAELPECLLNPDCHFVVGETNEKESPHTYGRVGLIVPVQHRFRFGLLPSDPRVNLQ
jgi:hypothetical protein